VSQRRTLLYSNVCPVSSLRLISTSLCHLRLYYILLVMPLSCHMSHAFMFVSLLPAAAASVTCSVESPCTPSSLGCSIALTVSSTRFTTRSSGTCGADRISSEAACVAAATQDKGSIVTASVTQRSSTYYPRGCYRLGAGSYYFNTGSSSATCTITGCVCLCGIAIPLTFAPRSTPALPQIPSSSTTTTSTCRVLV